MQKNIILLGYMGCGKSSVGKLLAETLKMKFIDLDTYIEKKENQSISNTFSTKGQLYFRKLERICLEKVMDAQKTPIVISLGGGTPCYFDTHKFLLENKQKTIYLKSTIKELAKRLFNEKEKRPILNHLKTKDKTLEFIAKHLFERSPFYEKSLCTIAVNNKPINVILNDILKVI